MSGRGRKIVHLAILLVFLFVAGTIDLFHTDGLFGKDPRCPACTFQSSAIADISFQEFQLPSLTAIEAISYMIELPVEELFILPETARAPPLA
jgi:hypothetical protein